MPAGMIAAHCVDELIAALYESLSSAQLRDPSIQATAEANNLAAVAGAKDMYNKNMEQVSEAPLPACNVSSSACA